MIKAFLLYLAVVAGLSAQTLAQLQASYVSQKCGAILHFNIETFVCATQHSCAAAGNIDPNLFAPTGLNIGQWLDAVVAGGCKYAVLTVKHGNGFVLYPTAQAVPTFSPYSIAQTTWYTNNGSPDIVGLFVAGCRSRSLNPVLYFTIRDLTYELRSNTTAATGAAAYISFVEAQLNELLSNYGAITAIWIDDWYTPDPTTPGDQNGGLGHYTNIPFATIYNFIKGIQPLCLVVNNDHQLSLSTTDIIEYELDAAGVTPSNPSPLPPSNNTAPSEAVSPIRWDGDWFTVTADPQDDGSVQSSRQIHDDMVFLSGRATSYLIGMTPTQAGVIPYVQLNQLTVWPTEGKYGANLATGATVTSSSLRSGGFSTTSVTDLQMHSNRSTYLNVFFSGDGDQTPWVEIDLGSVATIGRVEIFSLNNTVPSQAGRLRDITVTIYDNAHALLYTSPTLNPLNKLGDGTYFNGPSQITLSELATDGRYVRLTRAGTDTTGPGCQLAIMEMEVYAH